MGELGLEGVGVYSSWVLCHWHSFISGFWEVFSGYGRGRASDSGSGSGVMFFFAVCPERRKEGTGVGDGYDGAFRCLLSTFIWHSREGRPSQGCKSMGGRERAAETANSHSNTINLITLTHIPGRVGCNTSTVSYLGI